MWLKLVRKNKDLLSNKIVRVKNDLGSRKIKENLAGGKPKNLWRVLKI